jgi:hypothetical protein
MIFLEIFDYMYFRIAQFYVKIERNSKVYTSATIAVTLTQFLILIDIVGTVLLENYSQENRAIIIRNFFMVFIVLLAILNIFNYKRYYNAYDKYNEKWSCEDKKRRILKGIVVFILFVIPLMYIPILLSLKDYTI